MVGETAFERLFHVRAPLLHGGTRRAGLVAQIVAVAHEGIDGAHGFALLGGKQHERIVEVLGAAARHVLAVSIGLFDGDRHAARRPPKVPKATRATEPSSRPTRSALEMAGRAPSTPEPCRLIFSGR